MMNDEKEAIEELIKRYQKSYLDDGPELPDADFDRLWDNLKKIGKKTHKEKKANHEVVPLKVSEVSEEENIMYQEWEDWYKDTADTEVRKTVFIKYKDAKGDISERYIEVKNVFKKDDITYLYAFCYLSADIRMFRLDRVLSMMDKPGHEIKNIEGYLTEQLSVSSGVLSETLASQALEAE